MKNKVCIVGSGNSLNGRNLGNKIDSFDNIIRFGGADVDLHDFAIDTGVKFTKLYHNCNVPAMRRLKKRLVHDQNKYKSVREIVFAHTVFRKKQRNCFRTLRRNLQKLEFSYRLGDILSECNEKIKKYECDEFIFPPREKRLANPTSGLYAILDSLERYDEIYLCGFDALCNSYSLEKSPRHYYGTGFELRHKHNLRREADLVRKLMKTRGGIYLW